MKHAFIFCAVLCFSAPILAEDIVLKTKHPSTYVIKGGDTLWDIASRFLRDPWRWPDIWHVNPQITNPHLIYPGDQVELTFKDGKPQLVLRRGNSTQDRLRVVKLSPRVRKKVLERAIPTIPLDAIQQFLSRPNVMTREAIDGSPYILSMQDNHLVAGSGDTIYARKIVPGSNTRYSLIRAGDTYKDTVNGKETILGLEAVYIGEALVNSFGDPTTLTLTASSREALKGDKLIPAISQELEYNYIPHAPKNKIDGKIISVVDGVSRIGQYHTVVINRGSEQGMEKGHVLAIFQSSRSVTDEKDKKLIRIPDMHAGYLLLFRIFDKVSYALVMRATKEIRLLDAVRNP